VFDLLGNPDSLSVKLDTGNSWLGGAAPVASAIPLSYFLVDP
jgi:inosose dehydratase